MKGDTILLLLVIYLIGSFIGIITLFLLYPLTMLCIIGGIAILFWIGVRIDCLINRDKMKDSDEEWDYDEIL